MAQPESVAAPSGKVYQWTQPPRRVHWKHGRAGRTFASKVQEIAEGTGAEVSDDERGMMLLESLSDSELERLEVYADDVLKHGLGHPPGDMPETDYWYFFARSVYAVKEMKVETTEGDTTVEAVGTFRKKLGLPSDGEDVPDAGAEHGAEDGDTRPAAG